MKYINNNVANHDVLLDDVSYSYDNMSNVIGIHSLTGNKAYTYDNMYRMTRVDNKNKAGDTLLEYTGYSYNNMGYRSGVDNNGTTQDSYSYYTDSDRLQTVSGKALMYDDGGNERSDGTNNYFHDDMNMLTQVMIGGTNGSIMYSYDLENRLKTRRNTNGNILNIYFYDGRDIVMEKDTAGNINSLYVRGTGGEMLKEKRRYTNTSGSFTTKYYYYPDRIGSVYMVTDDHGMILEKENADAFGNSKTVGISKYGLTSNMYDTDTGFYYFAARWYDPKIGRFLEMDPMLSEQGMMNMYEYCASNPASLTDRWGERTSGNDLWSNFLDVVDYVASTFSKGDDKVVSQESTNDLKQVQIEFSDPNGTLSNEKTRKAVTDLGQQLNADRIVVTGGDRSKKEQDFLIKNKATITLYSETQHGKIQGYRAADVQYFRDGEQIDPLAVGVVASHMEEIGGVGVYEDKHFTHIDIRPRVERESGRDYARWRW
jgi:RHS repeat-associated protein